MHSSRGGPRGRRRHSPDRHWRGIQNQIEACLQALLALPGANISRVFNLPAGPTAAESIWILRFNQKSPAGEDGETAFRYVMMIGCLEQVEVELSTDTGPRTGIARVIEKAAYPKNR